MNIKQFFDAKDVYVRAIFITTRDIEVTSYVWCPGQTWSQGEQWAAVPKGTELIAFEYSNFGTGYSMCPLHPRKLFKGKGTYNRWFKVLFAEMEFNRYEFMKR